MFFGLYETLALLIQGAYLMHEGLTPTSEKPKISFSCGLDKLKTPLKSEPASSDSMVSLL